MEHIEQKKVLKGTLLLPRSSKLKRTPPMGAENAVQTPAAALHATKCLLVLSSRTDDRETFDATKAPE